MLIIINGGACTHRGSSLPEQHVSFASSDLKATYSRRCLLCIRRNVMDTNPVFVKELRGFGLVRKPAQSPAPSPAPSPQWRRHRRNIRKQKRGKRGGVRARLADSPHRPAVPTITLANLRLLDNKLDYIRLLWTTSKAVDDCCVFVFVETWLNDSVPDIAIQLAGLTRYRADRALVEGGKLCSGGLCVYISDAWCHDVAVACIHCLPLVELMIIKFRPFYLPREFTAFLQ